MTVGTNLIFKAYKYQAINKKKPWYFFYSKPEPALSQPVGGLVQVKPIRITRKNIGNLKRLLDMQYKPSEIAQEVGLTVDTIYRSHIPAGAPSETDKNGNMWINGKAYRQWVESFATVITRKEPMPDNHGYCFTCKEVREIQNPKVKPFKRDVEIVKGKCPVCGKSIARFVSTRKDKRK